MKISPNFIPHEMFHKGYWLNPVKDNSWYYFQPSKREFDTKLPKEFYSTLDEKFKGIVPYLHQKGIPTTPSCTGHFKNNSTFKKVYSNLEKHKSEINNNGLLLQNPETGEFLKYYNPTYSLPWDENQFVEKCSEYQKRGCLGLIINDYYQQNELMDIDFNTNTYWDDNTNCFLIITKPDTEIEMNGCWDNIINLIKEII
jgi:hypothetical protein